MEYEKPQLLEMKPNLEGKQRGRLNCYKVKGINSKYLNQIAIVCLPQNHRKIDLGFSKTWLKIKTIQTNLLGLRDNRELMILQTRYPQKLFPDCSVWLWGYFLLVLN